jgi:ATP-dependent RNA helicase RhlE
VKFTELNLHKEILKNIEELGFTDATPIQEQSFDPIIQGKDIAGLAQTGTGKTAAFLMPLIQRILTKESTEEDKTVPFDSWSKANFILILVPTRELAEQVHDNVKKLTQGMDITSTVLYGGTSYDGQKEALNSGVDFIVSTPGRLIDLYKEHHLDLKQAKAIVFDEADRMFDMGFKDDMTYILQRIPKDRQYLVYSATLDFEVLNTAYEFGAQPIEIDISKDETSAENVTHEIMHVGQDEKPQFLLSLIKKHNPSQLIIFTNFKSNVDRITQFLNKNNIRAHGISSLLNQKQRNRIMSDFKEGKVRVLVATDVAARGLDVKNVDLVLNFDLPDDAATYVHRIGRTGRAEATGLAFSLVSDRDVNALQRIERLLHEKLSVAWVENEEIVKEFKPFPEFVSHRKLKNIERKKQGAKKTGKRPQPKGDRRKKSRTQDKTKDEKFKKARKKSPKSFKEAGSKEEVHRDRRQGRHNDKSTVKRKTKNKNTRTRNSQSRKRSQRPTPPVKPVQTTSIGKKVKSFLKDLFN